MSRTGSRPPPLGWLLASSTLCWLVAQAASGHPNETVTVVEIPPHGLLVSTSESNYALVSPKLIPLGWLSVSRNGNQIYLQKLNGSISGGLLSHLKESKLLVLGKLREAIFKSLAELPPPGHSSSSIGYKNGDSYSQVVSRTATPYVRCPSTEAYESNDLYPGGLMRRHVYSVWRQAGVTFSYHNLHQSDILHKLLSSDVYRFDLTGNVLDVFSRSASVRESLAQSIVFRDESSFAYSRPCMPLTINRLVVWHKHIFFVYNDASVLVKSIKQLDSIELDLVRAARAKVKSLVDVQRGRKLLAKDKLSSSQEPELNDR